MFLRDISIPLQTFSKVFSFPPPSLPSPSSSILLASLLLPPDFTIDSETFKDASGEWYKRHVPISSQVGGRGRKKPASLPDPSADETVISRRRPDTRPTSWLWWGPGTGTPPPPRHHHRQCTVTAPPPPLQPLLLTNKQVSAEEETLHIRESRT